MEKHIKHLGGAILFLIVAQAAFVALISYVPSVKKILTNS